jgi:hypothetical protein
MSMLRSLLAALVLLGPGLALSQERGVVVEKDDQPTFRAGVRLHSLWTLDDTAGEPSNAFSIEMARVKLQWDPDALLRAAVSADFDQLFGVSNATKPKKSMLRDAYLHLKPLRALRVKVGQFKRPFSRLELRSRRRLEVVRRGYGNAWIVEELGFGDRDLGIQLDGRFGKRKRGISYALGVFNGPGRNAAEVDLNGTKDLVFRLEGNPVKWLSLGANVSVKNYDVDSVDYYPEFAWMTGADFRFNMKGFSLLGEGLFGLNQDRCASDDDPADCRLDADGGDLPYSYGATLMATYRFRLGTTGMKLQPVLRGEILVPDDTDSQARLYSAGVGANLLIIDGLRLMVHGETVRTDGNLPAFWTDANRLLVQLAYAL